MSLLDLELAESSLTGFTCAYSAFTSGSRRYACVEREREREREREGGKTKQCNLNIYSLYEMKSNTCITDYCILLKDRRICEKY